MMVVVSSVSFSHLSRCCQEERRSINTTPASYDYNPIHGNGNKLMDNDVCPPPSPTATTTTIIIITIITDVSLL